MDPQPVAVTITDDVAHVQLNRPDKLNAINLEVIDGLIDAARMLRSRRDIRAITLGGRGRSFSAGLDFASTFTDKKRVARYFLPGLRRANRFQRVNAIWRELPIPVIAVVHGHCFGAGLQLALGADFRLTTPDAQWSIMEAKWGLVPDMSGTVPLAELVPSDVAMSLTMSGRIISGQEAAGLGLATHAHDDPQTAAGELVGELSARSPDSVAATKRLLYGTRRGTIRSALRLERALQAKMFRSPNTRIARKAGESKTEPQFGHRTFGS